MEIVSIEETGAIEDLVKQFVKTIRPMIEDLKWIKITLKEDSDNHGTEANVLMRRYDGREIEFWIDNLPPIPKPLTLIKKK